MIVDPNTGQPIIANTIGGQVGMNALDAAGASTPLMQSLLASLPTASHTMGWNIRRTSNTMLKGGRRRAQNARGIRQTFSPFAFNRLSNASNIEPLAGSKVYTPFNFLSTYANKGVGRLAKRNPGLAAKWFGSAGSDGTWFSPGTMGRLSSMSSIARASERRLARMAPNIYQTMIATNPEQYMKFWQGYKTMENITGTAMSIGRNELGQMAGLSMRGSISQQIAGYAHASAMNKIGIGLDEAVSVAGRGSFFGRGAALQAEHLASNNAVMRFGAKSARYLPDVSRAAGVVGTVLLVHDLAVMSGKVLAAAGRTAIEGANSIKGSIDKPIMGMGFKDNMIAATSRQRGVMAIQNSRLNMRSVLGNEAAGIHAAWG